eukprot:GEMP01065931.1.p2 GENE.GEMP01065931.1~~GEMP01065931.1.p2  ORF type:complete len:112 (+),score=13.68 GEMP01065931.1:308-643(+)
MLYSKSKEYDPRRMPRTWKEDTPFSRSYWRKVEQAREQCIRCYRKVELPPHPKQFPQANNIIATQPYPACIAEKAIWEPVISTSRTRPPAHRHRPFNTAAREHLRKCFIAV